MLILSLFPGAGLAEGGFIEAGHCVVRGPDILWGQDIKDFHGVPDKFDMIIGGPPCQLFSKALRKNHKTKRLNLIPEFLRVVGECQPRYVIMENVPQARPYAPDWPWVSLCDSDIGGLTKRIRRFWFKGFDSLPEVPITDLTKYRNAAYSVLATSRKNRGEKYPSYPQYFPDEAARLQGYPDIEKVMMSAWSNEMNKTSKEYLAVQLIGNGWTKSMSSFLADWVTRYDKSRVEESLPRAV